MVGGTETGLADRGHLVPLRPGGSAAIARLGLHFRKPGRDPNCRRPPRSRRRAPPRHEPPLDREGGRADLRASRILQTGGAVMNVAARLPTKVEFSKDALVLDAAAEVERIVEALRKQVLGAFGRRGAVVGLSGGIDSSVVAALCAHAFGNDKVLGVFMPEHHSSDDSLRLGRSWAAQLGIARPRGGWGPAPAA